MTQTDIEGIGTYFQKQGYQQKQGHYLNVEQVIQIFAMLSCEVPVYEIGKHFAVSSQMVYHIKNGTRWSWVRDKLLEPTDDTRIRHAWVPDPKRKGKYICEECGVRYDQLVMFAKCPVREKQDDAPIYLSWKMPEPKKPQYKMAIPGANLKRVRQYKKKEAKLRDEFNRKKDRKRARDAQKEAHRQKLLAEVAALRMREALAQIARGENQTVGGR